MDNPFYKHPLNRTIALEDPPAVSNLSTCTDSDIVWHVAMALGQFCAGPDKTTTFSTIFFNDICA
jgi:hypothetical protein